jgi:nucleotide-binding universal stress UspA family protein
MFRQILVAVDGSATGNRGLKAAIDLAADDRSALSIVHVIDDMASVSYVGDMGYVPADYVDRMLDDLRAKGRKLLAKAEAAARERGVDAQALLVESKGGSIADAILGQARKLRADVIVLGTHGRRGLTRVLMGSDAEEVLSESRVPVLLVRAAPGPRPKEPSAPKAGGRPAKRAGRREPEPT